MARRALWASNTFGPPGHVYMQADGNLVIYNAAGAPVFAVPMNVAGSSLLLQNDGNLVLRAPGGAVLWASNSNPAAPAPPDGPNAPDDGRADRPGKLDLSLAAVASSLTGRELTILDFFSSARDYAFDVAERPILDSPPPAYTAPPPTYNAPPPTAPSDDWDAMSHALNVADSPAPDDAPLFFANAFAPEPTEPAPHVAESFAAETAPQDDYFGMAHALIQEETAPPVDQLGRVTQTPDGATIDYGPITPLPTNPAPPETVPADNPDAWFGWHNPAPPELLPDDAPAAPYEPPPSDAPPIEPQTPVVVDMFEESPTSGGAYESSPTIE